MVGLLYPIESDELHHGIVTKPACLQEVAVQLRRGAVQITLRTNIRETSLNTPMSTQQSCAEPQRLLMAVIRTATEVNANERFRTDILRLHVQRSTKGAGTIRRGSHTTLYLHRLHTTGKVTHVHPVELGRLGIVHRDSVGRDVDTAGIRTTHTQRRIAYAVSSIRRHSYRGSQRQQVWNILTMVDSLQLIFTHIGKCHWHLSGGTGRHHLYVLQLHTFQCICLFRLCSQCHTHQRQHQKFSHVSFPYY